MAQEATPLANQVASVTLAEELEDEDSKKQVRQVRELLTRMHAVLAPSDDRGKERELAEKQRALEQALQREAEHKIRLDEMKQHHLTEVARLQAHHEQEKLEYKKSAERELAEFKAEVQRLHLDEMTRTAARHEQDRTDWKEALRVQLADETAKWQLKLAHDEQERLEYKKSAERELAEFKTEVQRLYLDEITRTAARHDRERAEWKETLRIRLAEETTKWQLKLAHVEEYLAAYQSQLALSTKEPKRMECKISPGQLKLAPVEESVVETKQSSERRRHASGKATKLNEQEISSQKSESKVYATRERPNAVEAYCAAYEYNRPLAIPGHSSFVEEEEVGGSKVTKYVYVP